MSARALIFVVVALVMAGSYGHDCAQLSLVGASAALRASEARAATSHKKRDGRRHQFPAGSFVKPEHVRWQAWPEEAVGDSYLLEGTAKPEDIVGAVVRRGIAAGEPVTNGRIVRPGDRGFLAAVLQPGMRAISVSVNPTTGIAGLVFPGDRVDLLLTQTIPSGNTPRMASETVLENVRVLAIDQVLNDQSGEPTLGKNTTIEVTPKQAEVVAVASDLGKLSLSLRSLARPATGKDALDPAELVDELPEPWRGETYTWDSEASRVLASRHAPRAGGGGGGGGYKVVVFHGGKAEEVSVGGGQ